MLTYRDYTASLWVDEDAGLICGKVDNISRDSLPFQGRTYEDAKQDFIKTIEAYIEFCRNENIEPEKPVTFSGKLPFRTSSDTHRAIAHKAKQMGKSINTWLEELALNALKEPETKQNQGSGIPSKLLGQLESQPELMEHFFDQIAPHLKNGGPVGTFKFLGAVEKVLPGLKAIKSHLKAPNPEVMGKIVREIEAWTEDATEDSEEPVPKRFVKEERRTGQSISRK
ncbi:type II toxin-antitoxin system HicB family antitoxin [Phormidesmis sp. 146-33]